jgi:hypothetical protein
MIEVGGQGIWEAIKCLSTGNQSNPYGDGNASQPILGKMLLPSRWTKI